MKTRQSAIQSTSFFFALLAILCGAPAALSQDADQSDSDLTIAAASEEGVLAPVQGWDAEEKLKKMMEEKKIKRWDSKKKRISLYAVADFKTKDPATDKDLYSLREAAAKRAILDAKAGIIEMIDSKMSAEDLFEVPGSDVSKELGAEYDAIQAKIIAQRDRLARLLEQIDAAEAKSLREATFGERLKDLMAAATKKLDATYNSSARQEAGAKEYESTKASYEEAISQYENLLAKAKELKPRSTQTSKIGSLAQMPLYGSSVILQTESWEEDTGIYQVAVLVSWSPELERTARSVATSKPIQGTPGAKSVEDWLADKNLALMVGSRQYIDDEGNRWFLGITAREYSKAMSSSRRDSNRQLAQMFARQMALFSIYADVESWKAAQQMIKTYSRDDQDETDALDSAARKISQVIDPRHIQGLMEVAGGKFIHPISGAEIYVSVFGINAAMVKDCIDIEAANIAAKIEDNIHQSEKKGRRQANEAAVKASENRAADIARGAAAQKQAIDNKAEENTQTNTRQIQKPRESAPATQKKSTGGVFSGDVDVSDDF